MVRQTSIEAYRRIKAEGLLSTRRLQVYEALFDHGPMTQNECWDLVTRRHGSNITKQSIGPRFAELLERGVIQVVGKSECRMSGHNCLTWDVTDQLPVEPEKREGEIHRLRRENSDLRKELADIQARYDQMLISEPLRRSREPLQTEMNWQSDTGLRKK